MLVQTDILEKTIGRVLQELLLGHRLDRGNRFGFPILIRVILVVWEAHIQVVMLFVKQVFNTILTS